MAIRRRNPMRTFDLKKQLKPIYAPSAKEPEIVRIPAFNFLTIDGAGSPSEMVFQESIHALYGVAFTAKFNLKFARMADYPVMALEGLWWMRDEGTFDPARQGDWQWKLQILTPSVVTPPRLRAAIDAFEEKRGPQPLARRIRLERRTEGRCAQIMHVGPYADEPATIDRLKAFIRERGLRISGLHHEIYMSDPRRVRPERMKTILRYPVEKES